MEFHFVADNKCIMGEFKLYDDSSLIYEVDNGGYFVLLGGNWAFCLIVDYNTGRCEGFETLVDALKAMKMQKARINPQNIQKGSVYFNTNKILEKNSGCNYTPFENNVYYDRTNNTVCIGTLSWNGDLIEFAKHMIAVIEQGKLVSLILQLEGLSIDA